MKQPRTDPFEKQRGFRNSLRCRIRKVNEITTDELLQIARARQDAARSTNSIAKEYGVTS